MNKYAGRIVIWVLALLCSSTIGWSMAQSPHASLDLDCQLCHITEDWHQLRSPVEYKHEQWPLEGQHASLNCRQCHESLDFTVVKANCSACHIDMHDGYLGQDCERCHNTTSWLDFHQLRLDHEGSGFPLRGEHARLDCRQCHQGQGWQTLGADCFSCHSDDYLQTQTPVHSDAGFSADCAQCHDQRVNEWTTNVKWSHTAEFPLTGAHAVDDCASCHASGSGFVSASAQQCALCHKDDAATVIDPPHGNPPSGIYADCAQCHDGNSWSGVVLDHTITGYALTGAHAALDCALCHVEGYAGTSSECWSCHEDDYQGAADPNHQGNAFSTTCSECHATEQWVPATFDHNLTEFPLTGAHTDLECVLCHVEGYTGTSPDCWSCHEDDYAGAADPDHAANAFSTTCSECHGTEQWVPATFDHNLTEFPLTGAHTNLECALCHVDGYTGTSPDCWSCHEDDYAGAADPDHAANTFSTTCNECHGTEQWVPATFDHSLTEFPLTGAHAALECALCHADGYIGTSSECWSCHEDDYTATTDPDHATNAFSTVCSECHGTSHWTPAEFDHYLTDFPLTGAHADLECALCHVEGYTGTSPDCWSCHEDDYAGAADPDHAANAFSTVCSECHGTEQWVPATFDHSLTEFPLTGAHAALECALCHADGYTGTSPDCWSCHEDDYAGAADPDHAANAFSTVCSECHGTEQWVPATFDHSLTEFPLTGAHAALECALCHADGYTGTSPDCWSCHEDDYTETDDPDHVDNAFSTVCSECHNTTAWTPADFDHDQTEFPLTGSHIGLDCSECHVDGQYAGTPSECYFCHEEDYNDADDPDHSGAGFPTDCAQCHTTTDWDDVNFNHDSAYFRIYSGAHRNEWDSCSECHTNSSDYTVFSCIGCHEHRQSAMDQRHNHVSGYVYESSACYDCHRNARSSMPGMRLPDSHPRQGVIR